jgi:acyl-CoA thioesterase
MNMHQIKAAMARDEYAKHSGMELVEVSPGHARVSMAIRKEHFNGLGVVHGGAIFTLADFAFEAAANAHGTIAVAINVNISYLRPVTGTMLYAEASELSRSRSIGSYTVRVTDEKEQLIAIFQGMVYRKGDPIPTAACGADSPPTTAQV